MATRADAARNAERILDAARDTFRDRGPSAPFYEIARSAGVGQATLYRHFPNKPALIRAIIEDDAQALEGASTALLDGPDPFASVLAALGDQIADHANLSMLMNLELEGEWYDRLIDRIVDVLESAKNAALDSGEIERDSSRAELRLVLHMMGGAAAHGDATLRRENIGLAQKIILEGIRK